MMGGNGACGRVAGYYKIEAFKLDGSRRVVADWFPNLITNVGLNQLGLGGVITRMQVGSGSTPPAFTDTALAVLIGTTTDQQSRTYGDSGGVPTWYGWTRYVYRFAPGVADGDLTEVGIGTTTVLFSRALILDGGGSPTTITILPEEYLDITYELRLYPPSGDVSTTITMSGASHDVVIRPSAIDNSSGSYWQCQTIGTNGATQPPNVTFYSGDIGDQFSIPGGTAYSGGNPAIRPYVANSLQRTWDITLALGSANSPTGLRSVRIMHYSFGGYQVRFDPVLMKTSSHVMTLPFTYSWARL